MKVRGYDIAPLANLSWADLYGANLRGANLYGANLSWANLRGANLSWANLYGACLYGATYSIVQALLAAWGLCPPDVTSQLMRLDAEALPHGRRLMNEWANMDTIQCPLDRAVYDRVAVFKERRECWPPKGLPWTMWEIWQRLAQAKGVRISMPWVGAK